MSRLPLSAGVLFAGAALTFSLVTRVPSVLADSERHGKVNILKNCGNYNYQAGSYCTIQISNIAEIPKGATVFYDQAAGVPTGMLDSNVVLFVAVGDWAVGRCTLDAGTGSGLCTFSDGVGKLSGFHARVAVAPASGANNFSWTGTYSFGDN